eukprot:761145-Hanusia_phi.AAC.1
MQTHLARVSSSTTPVTLSFPARLARSLRRSHPPAAAGTIARGRLAESDPPTERFTNPGAWGITGPAPAPRRLSAGARAEPDSEPETGSGPGRSEARDGPIRSQSAGHAAVPAVTPTVTEFFFSRGSSAAGEVGTSLEFKHESHRVRPGRAAAAARRP